MKTTAAQQTTPPTTPLNGVAHQPVADTETTRNSLYGAALGLSLQLAVVVLLPVIAGFKLDSHLASSPLWTLIGFAVAMIGMVAVVWKESKLFSPKDSGDHAEDGR